MNNLALNMKSVIIMLKISSLFAQPAPFSCGAWTEYSNLHFVHDKRNIYSKSEVVFITIIILTLLVHC